MIEAIAGSALVTVTRLLVGARAQGTLPAPRQAIFFANHTSHLDTLAIWSALPPAQRARTRPVAARDYWEKPGLRNYLADRVLRAVLIDRTRAGDADPLLPVLEALGAGYSLVLFPEGTRTARRLPGEFRSGLYRLAERFPSVELVPVYLDTLRRSMPKGSTIPLPLYCNVRFGAALQWIQGESCGVFLTRTRDAVVALA